MGYASFGFRQVPVMGNVRTNEKPLIRITDRLVEQVFKLYRTKLRKRLGECQQRTRCCDRAVADVVDVVLQNEAETVFCFSHEFVSPHILGRCKRCASVEIDTRMTTIRQSHVHHPKSRDATH